MTVTINNGKAFFNKYRDAFICLFLVMATLAVYWQVKNYDFVKLDDNLYLSENRYVQGGFNIEGIKWSFTNTDFGMWIPLTWLSYMSGSQMYGKSPGWHHLTNVFLHLANISLLFLLLKKLTGNFWQSALAAALFSLHPMHVESVAWVTERKDVLSTFFLLLTILVYSRYVDRPGIGSYLLAVIFFSFGLMSKPMLVTLPFALLLLDFWPLGRFQFEQSAHSNSPEKTSSPVYLVIEKTPFFVLSVLTGVMTFLAHQKLGGIKSISQVSLDSRIANSIFSYANYIRKLIWPSNLTVLYPHPGTLPGWQVVFALLLLTAISLLVIGNMRQRPYLMVGWLWYLGTLVPVIGLFHANNQYMADRFVYVPFIGLYIMIAWGFSELISRQPFGKIRLAALAVVLLSILMVVTWKQVRYWQNSMTLFGHTFEVTSNNWKAHNNLGVALFEQGKVDEAIHHYRTALSIRPGYMLAHSNLGVALAKRGNLTEAASHYKTALRINPEFAAAHYNFGSLLLKQVKFKEAMGHFAQAIRIHPEYTKAYYAIGWILELWGKHQGARYFFTKALQIDPDFVEARKNLENVDRILNVTARISN